MQIRQKFFLLGIDLEDIRDRISHGERYPARVQEPTQQILDFFQTRGIRTTFFVVGKTARDNPELLRRIIDAGHEIACHSDQHRELDKMSPREFAEDLRINIRSLEETGAREIIGYRAPTLSLKEATKWAYPILEDHGIRYSSSVLPSLNPLHGWKEFGTKPKKIGGVWELPITITNSKFLPIPVAAGTYLRLLPFPLIRHLLPPPTGENPDLVGYIHPYDVDTRQAYFMHPELNNNHFFNLLMFVGRSGLLRKIDQVMRMGYQTVPYRDKLAGLTVDS